MKQIKEQKTYSMFFRKEYTENFENEYKDMQKDIHNNKFNLSVEEYVRVYKQFFSFELCNELVEDIKKYPIKMKFSGSLSDSLRKGEFVNTYFSQNEFTQKIENLIETSIEKISKKYTQDVRPLYYAYGDNFNHYTYHILKYTSDDYFKIHHDHYAETLNHSRLLTVCIYLNEDYTGGELEFPSVGNDKEYSFKTGDIIVFPSNWMFYHGVKPILSGERYTIVIWIGLDLSDTETKYFST